MEKNTKYQILKYILIFLLFIFSFFLWRSVDRAIFVEEASVWTAPIIWASLFFIALSLSVILIKEKYWVYSAVFVSLFSSLYFSFASFSFSIVHPLVLLLAALLIFYALKKISDDFDSRLQIDLGKNIRSGSALIIFALSLAISFQYYFETKNLATEKYLPSFEIGKATNQATLKMLSNFWPQAKGLANENLTVDQFVIDTYEKQKSGGGASLKTDSLVEEQLKNLDPAQRFLAEKSLQDAEKKMVLEQGKKQISQLLFREVEGGEKISDVFGEVVNKKINSYFMPSLGRGESSSLFSAIIALVIFLTATSLGSFLMIFLAPLVKIIFFFLRQFGAVSVVKIPAKKEVIE
jgi:hypothetical protein